MTLSGRTFLWKKGIYQFFQKPFCGYGYGHKIDLGLYGHNLIIELMVTTGILGVSIYFLFLAKAFAGPGNCEERSDFSSINMCCYCFDCRKYK